MLDKHAYLAYSDELPARVAGNRLFWAPACVPAHP